MNKALKKFSVFLDAEAAEAARKAAKREESSLSDWLAAAVSEAAHLSEAHAAIAEYIEEYGEPDPETEAKARADLDAAGIGEPESRAEARARMRALERLHGGER